MPFYIDDPDAPGTQADVLEVQRRDPLRELFPVLMNGWMKCDQWTRREALLLLSGYDPDETDWGGHTIVASREPGFRRRYLDGSLEHELRYHGVQHPRYEINCEHILTLSKYANGGAIDERRPSAVWMKWAASKDFVPYWLSLVTPSSEAVHEELDGPAQSSSRLSPGRTESPSPELKKRRLNAIGRDIQAAIARLENGATRADINQHTVMAELVKSAGTPGCCITEVADGGKAVIWLDDEGQMQKLLKGALKKRLQRRL